MTESSEKRSKPFADNASRIFQPFRVIGHVTNHIPFTLLNRGSAFYVTTCVDKSFHIYDCEHLRLLFVGPIFEESIDALACIGDYTFVATGNRIAVCERAKEIFSLKEVSAKILQIIVVGDYLIALSEVSLLVWNYSTRELSTLIDLQNFSPCLVIHPQTYLNKVLVASKDGKMQLWNISTKKLIYEFASFNSPITAICQTPAVDVIAVGSLDGNIILFNIKTDQVLFKLNQSSQVTSITLSFDGEPFMATGNNIGDIFVWNLDSKKLVHTLRSAHDSAIYGLSYLPNQPIIISTSSDNSIKEWIFDQITPRLLNSRSGHYEPSNMIRYYGPEGHYLLSAGRDHSFRLFSVVRDAQNMELSKKTKLDDLKLPQIRHFSTSYLRHKDWDNAVTCHKGENAARTWKVINKTIGSHKLASPDKSNITVTAVTPCGNFAILGCASGKIEMFNIQSGIHRKSFVGHAKEITGLFVNIESTLLVSTSLDKTVRFWSIRTKKEENRLILDSAPSLLVSGNGNLVAIACDDFGIRIVDTDSCKIVREFHDHQNRITDLTITADNRWVISSSMDLTIKTFDIPSGYLVDSLEVSSIPISLSFSPISDFLAVSFVDSVGIHLFFNKTQFNTIPLLPLDAEPVVWNEAFESVNHFITLSSLSRAKWINLFHLDNIKARNKPKAAPVAPKRAPFFLTAANSEPKTDNVKQESSSAMLKLDLQFNDLLESKNYDELMLHMTKMSPSSVDFEIRSLSIENEMCELVTFLEFIASQMQSKKNFELLQAYLNIFLKIHGDVVKQNIPVFQAKLQNITSDTEVLWNRMEPLFQAVMCMISYYQK